MKYCSQILSFIILHQKGSSIWTRDTFLHLVIILLKLTKGAKDHKWTK